jgi:hypothetical protein
MTRLIKSNHYELCGCSISSLSLSLLFTGVEISGINANVDELLAALTAAGVTQKPKAVSLNTNISAFLAFTETSKVSSQGQCRLAVCLCICVSCVCIFVLTLCFIAICVHAFILSCV